MIKCNYLVCICLSIILVFGKAANEEIGYIYQSYWYSSKQCQDTPSFVEAYQINNCIQTSDTQYMMYLYENATSTRTPFEASVRYYKDMDCMVPDGPASVQTYQKACTILGNNAVSSYYMEGLPIYLNPGGLTRFVL